MQNVSRDGSPTMVCVFQRSLDMTMMMRYKITLFPRDASGLRFLLLIFLHKLRPSTARPYDPYHELCSPTESLGVSSPV